MLSYFKLNDPFRLLPLLVLAFLIKLPTLLNPIVYSEATHWFVIGEAMQSGSMYSDIWDGMAPFSATIFQVFTWLLGRSTLSLLILGTLVTFAQATIINNLSISAKIFDSNTYLPALIYVLLTSTHPAFFTLSPVLLGLTFLLLGLGKLLTHVEFRAKTDIHIIMIGLYFGVSTLFYLPFIVIIPISLILLALFSNTVIRRYFLLLSTSFTPLIIAFFYYWLISDHSAYFISNFIFFATNNSNYFSIGWVNGLISTGFSSIFMIAGIFSIGKQRRLNNYQFRIAQLFFVLAILMMSMLLLERPISFYSLVVSIPFATYFTVHLVALIKKQLFVLILNLMLLLGPILLLWSISHNWIPQLIEPPKTSTNQQYINIVKNKDIMVLGSAKHLYNEATLAGPFYDWGLSKEFFSNLDYYDNLVFLQSQLTKSSPEIIIDLENNWPEISRKLPMVSKNYYLYQPKVWKRRN